MESENLQLEDGLYTVDVQLEGGSGSLQYSREKKSRGLNGAALTMTIWW